METTFDKKYTQICKLAVMDDKYFNTFRSNVHYTEILEHVSPNGGFKYIEHSLIKNNQTFDDDVKNILQRVDQHGGPYRFNFPNIGFISPTILRYYSILGDIHRLYGKLTNKVVVEIGCGYGGQGMMLDLFDDVKNYIFVDLPDVLDLIKKFLIKNNMNMSKYEFYTHNNVPKIDSDFLISNYAFSEVGKEIQDVYLNKLINNSKNFYMIINRTEGCYSNEELLTLLNGNVNIIREEPLSCSSNFLFYK